MGYHFNGKSQDAMIIVGAEMIFFHREVAIRHGAGEATGRLAPIFCDDFSGMITIGMVIYHFS